MTMQAMGIAGDRWAAAQRLAARNPAQARRILGLPPQIDPNAPMTIIDVDLKTGARTVTAVNPKVSREELKTFIEACVTDWLEANGFVQAVNDNDPSLDTLLAAACKAADAPLDFVAAGPTRVRLPNIVNARHLFWYLAYKLRPDLTLEGIARAFHSERHHTTIYMALRAFNRKRADNDNVKALCAHPEVSELIARADAAER